MKVCQNCHSAILNSSQVLCMSCGCQIKPLEIKLRIFGARRRHLVLIQHPPLAGKNLITWRYHEPKTKLKAPNGNLTLDNWF